MTSYTDAKGNTTTYGYNRQNELLRITYANGAQQRGTYDSLGEVTEYVNARGNSVALSYNANGQIVKKTFSDGTSTSMPTMREATSRAPPTPPARSPRSFTPTQRTPTCLPRPARTASGRTPTTPIPG